jgi:hypothetical protein
VEMCSELTSVNYDTTSRHESRVVYVESRVTSLIWVSYYRCIERLKTKTEGSKRFTYTEFDGRRGHLKIDMRLRGEWFESEVECVMWKLSDDLRPEAPRRSIFVVYYESMIKRELNRRLMYECRCDERLKAKAEGSTRLHTLGSAGRNRKEKKKKKKRKRNPPFTDLEDPSIHAYSAHNVC